MKKKIFIFSIVAIMVIVAGAIFIMPKSDKVGADSIEKKDEIRSEKTEDLTFSVKSDIVKRRNLQSYIEINGDIETDTKVEIYPDIGGKLTRLLVNLGSQVTKGQLIAEINPSIAGDNYALSPVYASISGTITSLPLRVGATVNTSSIIVIIGVIDDLQINAKVPERYINVLKVGLKAAVTLEAYPGVSFIARVTRLSPVVDSISRTKQIYLIFENRDTRINSGMFAKVKLDTVRYENRVTVQEDTVTTNFDDKYVFVLNDDMTVSKRIVNTGITVDGITEVLTGLQAGEKIVVQGMRSLSDGAKVRDITESGAKK